MYSPTCLVQVLVSDQRQRRTCNLHSSPHILRVGWDFTGRPGTVRLKEYVLCILKAKNSLGVPTCVTCGWNIFTASSLLLTSFIGPAAVDIFVLQSVISSIVTTALPSNHCHENI